LVAGFRTFGVSRSLARPEFRLFGATRGEYDYRAICLFDVTPTSFEARHRLLLTTGGTALS